MSFEEGDISVASVDEVSNLFRNSFRVVHQILLMSAVVVVLQTLRTRFNLIDYMSLDFYSVGYIDRGSRVPCCWLFLSCI